MKGPVSSRGGRGLTTVDDDTYTLPDGSQRPRVTRVIGALSKDALVPWAARLAAEYALTNSDSLGAMEPRDAVNFAKGASVRYMEKASALGTRVHDAVETMVMTGSSLYDAPEELQGHLRGWQAFVDLYAPKVLACEVLLCGPGYAGTVDLILLVDLGDGLGERVVICDLKTGKSVHPESVALQLSAYRYATHAVVNGALVPMPWPAITGGIVVHLRPRSAGVYPMRCDEVVFRQFQYVMQAHQWQSAHAAKCMGARVSLDPTTVPKQRPAVG